MVANRRRGKPENRERRKREGKVWVYPLGKEMTQKELAEYLQKNDYLFAPNDSLSVKIKKIKAHQKPQQKQEATFKQMELRNMPPAVRAQYGILSVNTIASSFREARGPVSIGRAFDILGGQTKVTRQSSLVKTERALNNIDYYVRERMRAIRILENPDASVIDERNAIEMLKNSQRLRIKLTKKATEHIPQARTLNGLARYAGSGLSPREIFETEVYLLYTKAKKEHRQNIQERGERFSRRELLLLDENFLDSAITDAIFNTKKILRQMHEEKTQADAKRAEQTKRIKPGHDLLGEIPKKAITLRRKPIQQKTEPPKRIIRSMRDLPQIKRQVAETVKADAQTAQLVRKKIQSLTTKINSLWRLPTADLEAAKSPEGELHKLERLKEELDMYLRGRLPKDKEQAILIELF